LQIRLVGAELFRVDGRTGRHEVHGRFRNSANAPTKMKTRWHTRCKKIAKILLHTRP